MPRSYFALPVALLAAVQFGCGGASSPPVAQSSPPTDEVTQERAKLTPQDRGLVDAQEWCAVSTEERLGAMGPPLKLDIKGQPVFVCCKGCKRKAEADPEKTLKTVADLKVKKKAAGG